MTTLHADITKHGSVSTALLELFRALQQGWNRQTVALTFAAYPNFLVAETVEALFPHCLITHVLPYCMYITRRVASESALYQSAHANTFKQGPLTSQHLWKSECQRKTQNTVLPFMTKTQQLDVSEEDLEEATALGIRFEDPHPMTTLFSP